ncbi:MAG TPA: 2-keto-gluconate dehydrogenase [Parvularcula sp.]|nr:2-keto-gluconate dehydrogenase [Parvularcula sp.]HBS35250.1 2-keto-gluconate dehydrogenase [Parvularcula sp.]
MKTFDQTDDSVVVVIGSGAGGGVLANELAQAGVNVVCLEAGRRLTFGDIVNDEKIMDERLTWHDRRFGEGILNPYFPAWMCKTVGGTTMHWTGTAVRLQAHEFAPKTHYALADTNAIDWPLTRADLDPYYDLAERKMGVSGTNGLPPLPMNNNMKVLAAGARALGYKRVTSTGVAINSATYDGRPQCQQIGFCKSGCVIGAKWSTLYTEVPKAEETSRFELRPSSMALKIEVDKANNASAVVYADAEGRIHRQRARAVCVAGNAIETPRILLNSASALHPDGLANGAGQVGRNYLKHVVIGALGFMPGDVHFYRGAQQGGHIADEQRHDEARGFAGGYQIESAAFSPLAVARIAFAGAWGEDLAAALKDYNRIAATFITGEDPAQSGNGVRLHPDEKDEYGLPVPIVRYEDHANAEPMRAHAERQARAIFEAVGAARVVPFRVNMATHNLGTCRMSADPRDGVCDSFGRAHEVGNLFISDGSAFSSSGSSNPTLTIVALAIRQAAHIRELMAKGDL